MFTWCIYQLVGRYDQAGLAKHALEEMQRSERRLREEKGDGWTPRWFKLAEEADLHELEQDVGTAVWEWNGEYEAHSAERSKKAKSDAKSSPLEGLEFNPWQYEETLAMGAATAKAGTSGVEGGDDNGAK